MSEGYDIDKAKEMVDKIFQHLEQKSKGKAPLSSDKARIEKELNLVPTPTGSMEEFSRTKALEEIEKIRQAFIEFQEKINELTMFAYMTGPLEQFVQYALDIQDVIEDNIDERKLSPESLKKYKSIKKLRAQILSNIYNKYKKDNQ